MKVIKKCIFLMSILLLLAGCSDNNIVHPSQKSKLAGSIGEYIIALDENGALIVDGDPDQTYNFDSWSGLVSVSSGSLNAGGIKTDGTAIITGYTDDNSWDVSGWKNIEMLEFTYIAVFGLKADGTVICTGGTYQGESFLKSDVMIKEVSTWRNINMIDTGAIGVAGIKNDGTVLISAPLNPEFNEPVSEWKDIRLLSISQSLVVGITEKNEVKVAPSNPMQLLINEEVMDKLQGLGEAVKVCAGQSFVAGLMPDDTLRVIRLPILNLDLDFDSLNGEENIEDINSYEEQLFVLKKDGTTVAIGQ